MKLLETPTTLALARIEMLAPKCWRKWGLREGEGKLKEIYCVSGLSEGECLQERELLKKVGGIMQGEICIVLVYCLKMDREEEGRERWKINAEGNEWEVCREVMEKGR